MNPITELLDATLWINGIPILWREIIGNLFGLACAWGGMRRLVWAWPVGIVGNALLFTVFMGGLFNTPQDLDLYGQAGRQVMFIIVSCYGWYQWSAARRGATSDEAVAVMPRWASNRERAGLVIAAVVGTITCAWIFQSLGSWGPWADAWIFVGSVLATYGMARGWTEFWLIWIAVDIVGVPLLLVAGYYPSAVLYLVYGVFVSWGFFVWMRVQKKEQSKTAKAKQPVLIS
ncbi:Nicotinamide riboside transporter PnuC [Corynebacterium faecale]|uniref:nicotinamide riboside transporter PnuC n=1 Tax=Corynebacterium faecale TaxID=1758466 RepID=UPI0025B4EF7D|nr:nicotinamide riboside transporter PnuC [Corynebacterium faecale]WJY90927.1 Nicotinamide riboside transporter PnuC [Corynebacterium faecale]